MAAYANLIADLPLLQALRYSSGRDQLSQTDVDQLYALALSVADAAGPLLSRISQMFVQYTEHDIGHCRNLLDICGRFIPPATLASLNAVELALLIVSILLHDFGMFVSTDEKQAVLASDEFRKFVAADVERQAAIELAHAEGRSWDAEYLRDAALAEFFRRLHPQRAAENIAKYITFPLRFREFDLTRHVALLAESHGWGVHEPVDLRHPEKTVREFSSQQPVYGVPVNLQYLACCLRLADIMDFDRSRTPISVFTATQFSEERSRLEWNKHLQISGWLIKPEEAAYAAECTRPVFYVAVMQFLNLIDREIQDCRRLLAQSPPDIATRYRIELSPLVDRSRIQMLDRSYLAGGYRFELDYDRIMALLMDRSLYADPSLFARELIQNGADACRYAAALAAEAQVPYVPTIVVEETEADGIRQVSVQDNGVGMSLEVLLNYFLRVGRSFYRSSDFLAARSRLSAAHIDLDATSRFGIGILSCFMVCDTFTVETYRRGQHPLRVTVEGATKYFVIQQLPEPERRDFEPQASYPQGPPNYPGTRVTLTLTKIRDLDIVSAITTTAVNLEYDVTVIRGSTERTTVHANGWQAAPLANDLAVAIGRPSALDSAKWELHERMWRERYDASLVSVLIPSKIDFESHVPTRGYRGAVWIWMLRDADGRPIPSRGYLRIRDALKLTGVPEILGSLVEHTSSKYAQYTGLMDVGQLLERTIDEPMLSPDARSRIYALISEQEDDDHDPDEITDDFAERWESLKRRDRSLLASSLRSLSKSPSNWRTVPGLADRLLGGDTSWATEPFEFRGDLPFNGLPQQFATFGMLLPGGILRWDPKAGFARKVRLLNGPAAVRADFRGANAPRPAANRLFIEASDAHDGAVRIIRAVIAHAVGLTSTGASPSWNSWFRTFINGSAELPFWRRAIFDELSTIEQLPVYRVGDDFITGAELRSRLGRWIVIESPNSRDVKLPTWGLNGHLLSVRDRRSSGELVEVDLETTRIPEPDVFQQHDDGDDDLDDV